MKAPLLFAAVLAVAFWSRDGRTQEAHAAGDDLVVRLDFADEACAAAARDLAQESWQRTWTVLGKPRVRGDGRPAVYLYRTAAAYEEAEGRRTGGRFRTHRAFSFPDDLSSHVLCEPFWDAETRARFGLPWQVRHLVAHEVVHLAVYAHTAARGRHLPAWFAEGMAQWIEDRVVHGDGGPSAMEDPWTSSSYHGVQELHDAGGLPGVATILAGDLTVLGRSDRYGVYRTWFAWLMTERRRPMERLLRRLPGMRGGPTLDERIAARIRRLAGRRADGAFGAWIEGREPGWLEVFRSLAPRGDGWLQASIGDFNAVAWRRGSLGGGDFTWKGTVQFVHHRPGAPDPVMQMNVLLDRQPGGFVSVALRAAGDVTVFTYHGDEDHWQRLAFAEVPALAGGGAVPVTVRRTGERLAVEVDGTGVIGIEVPDRPWDGPWGLGVQAGTTGVWGEPGVEVR